MDEQQTCGKGLASNASLPDKLGALTGAVADILEAHMPALDLTDPAAAQEHAAYAQLVAEHRAAAGRLTTIARHMEDSWSLPMGRHDPVAMAAPAVRAAFRSFVTLERELQALLQTRLQADEAMLSAMQPGR
jgi:hypothetical protein